MSAEKDSTTAGSSNQSKKRAQLSHVLIDVDFFDKPKIRSLEMWFGPLGTLLLVRLLGDISRATNAEIDDECFEFHAKHIGFALGSEFLDYCIDREILSRTSLNCISNSRVIEDQEKLAEQQDKWRKAKRVSKDSNENPRGIPEDSQSPLNVQKSEDLNTEELKNEDLKKLSNVTEEAFSAVKRWAAQRKKLGLGFDSLASEALQMQYAGRSDALIRDINASITANSRNIFQAQIPEEKRIAIAATAKAEALRPNETQRPKPKPIVFESPPKPSAEAEAKFKEDLKRIGKSVPRVSI